MNRQDCVFPVSPRAVAFNANDGSSVVENEIVGGLTVRNHVAIELFVSMAGNPALTAAGVTLDKLRTVAVDQANKFCADLEDPQPSQPPNLKSC